MPPRFYIFNYDNRPIGGLSRNRKVAIHAARQLTLRSKISSIMSYKSVYCGVELPILLEKEVCYMDKFNSVFIAHC